MAPPPKANKSAVTDQVYGITKDIRQHLDAHDHLVASASGFPNEGAKVSELNDALARARALVSYLDKEVTKRLEVAGTDDMLLRKANFKPPG